MDDLISRQAAIDAFWKLDIETRPSWIDAVINMLEQLPSAQPEHHFDEWCTECKEYDKERHCCPRFNHVIRTTLEEVEAERKKGRWLKTGQSFVFPDKFRNYFCSECGFEIEKTAYNYCPVCGADMRGEEDGND